MNNTLNPYILNFIIFFAAVLISRFSLRQGYLDDEDQILSQKSRLLCLIYSFIIFFCCSLLMIELHPYFPAAWPRILVLFLLSALLLFYLSRILKKCGPYLHVLKETIRTKEFRRDLIPAAGEKDPTSSGSKDSNTTYDMLLKFLVTFNCTVFILQLVLLLINIFVKQGVSLASVLVTSIHLSDYAASLIFPSSLLLCTSFLGGIMSSWKLDLKEKIEIRDKTPKAPKDSKVRNIRKQMNDR